VLRTHAHAEEVQQLISERNSELTRVYAASLVHIDESGAVGEERAALRLESALCLETIRENSTGQDSDSVTGPGS
jgi:hypothetical protein